uniref:Complement factor B-like n=1 Tax=Mastacembelus armatus TaxID=205130 RepID=A0A7N8X6D6_9TELE
NMQIQGGSYTLTKQLNIGSMLIYQCPDGYYPSPALTRLCQANGTWRPAPKKFKPQMCKRVECPDPNVLEYGSVNPPQEKYFVDNETTYECYSGYTLRGSSRRVCLPHGKWSGFTPICSRDSDNTCPDPGVPAGASREGNIFGIDDTVKYQCGSSLFLVGSNERVCQENGQWTGQEPACYCKHTFDTPLEVSEAFGAAIKGSLTTLEPTDDTQEGRIIRILKNGTLNIYIGVDISESIEEEHFRNARDAVLQLITKISSFSVRPESFKEHRHVLIIFTDGAYNMGGSPAPTVARIKNMVYMNQTTDQELKRKASREDYLATDKHYFRLKNIKNLQETFDDIIDESDVKGLCGLHKEYDTGGNIRKKYPWMAHITFKVNILGLRNKCFGSLVTPKFILTAAHCFKFGDLPEDVAVDIDDGQGNVKKVKTFMLHPNYNVKAKVNQGVPEFYDYDVALVQLEDDVLISSNARPICIPCTQETSGALQLIGESTCKQQEQLLLKDQLEALSFLTKTDKIKEKNVRAKLGDNRDECIRHALQAPGVTTKNPKDVVTDSFLCTGGLEPQIDHIACTGDSGGAVFKNYQQRTVQIGLVSWGTKNLCGGGGVVDSDKTSRDFHINLFRVIPFLKSILGNDTQNDYAPLQFLNN